MALQEKGLLEYIIAAENAAREIDAKYVLWTQLPDNQKPRADVKRRPKGKRVKK